MILVVGGAGYIGSHLVKLLKKSGKDVVVFDNFEKGHDWAVKNVEVFEGDLRNPEDVKNVFDKYTIDQVYHFAAYSLVGESMVEPYKYFDNNFKGTLNLVKEMVDHNVKYIVFSSTAATYGEPERIPITEDLPKQPTNVYGQSKLMMEDMLSWYSKLGKLNYVALRYFNAAGADPEGEIGEAHDPETHLVPIILKYVLGKRDKLAIFGDDYPTQDGTNVRDYIHVNDLGDAHIKAMEWMMRENKSEVFNLGNGKGFSNLEVIKAAEKVIGKEIKFEIAPRRAGDPATLIASSEKAQKVLGWTPKYPDLETIVEHAWNWHKKYEG